MKTETKNWTEKLNGTEFRITRLNTARTISDNELDSPKALIAWLKPLLEKSPVYKPDVENCIVVYLNCDSRPMGFEILSIGSGTECIADSREIFKHALIAGAKTIVIVHNHPYGEPEPSGNDIKCTARLIAAGELLDIPVLDNVIMGIPSEKYPDGISSCKEAVLLMKDGPLLERLMKVIGESRKGIKDTKPKELPVGNIT